MQHVKKQGLDQTEEYKAQWRLLMQQVEQTLAMQTLQNDLYKEVMRDISEEEARNYYKQYKEQIAATQPDTFIVEQGGVQAAMVQANSQEQAQQIKQAAQKADLKQAARDFDKQTNTFFATQKSSQPNAAVVRKALQLSSDELPQVDVVQSGDTFYVVRASEHVSPKYANFENVQEQVKQYMLQVEFQQKYGERVDQLIKQYDVQVNDELLKEMAGMTQAEDQQEATPASPQEPEAPGEPEQAA